MFVKYKIVLQLVSMFILFCVGGVSLTALLTSCGHNVVTHSRGVGMDISWDGSSYIPNLRLGQWDVTNAVVKENMDVFDFALTEDEMKAISSLDTGKTEIIDHLNVDTVLFLNAHKIHD